MRSVQSAVACSAHLPCLQMGWLLRLWWRVSRGGPPLEGLLWRMAAGMLGVLCACLLHSVTPAQPGATNTLQACLSALVVGSRLAISAALAMPKALQFVQSLPIQVTDCPDLLSDLHNTHQVTLETLPVQAATCTHAAAGPAACDQWAASSCPGPWPCSPYG